MMRRGTEQIAGGLTRRDITILTVVDNFVAVQGLIFGLIEPAFFTAWARQYNDPLNQAVILNHFSGLCVGMFLIAAITAFLPFTVNYALYGWTPRTQIFLIAAVIALPLWILFEDLAAHFRYGGIAADDWTHWFFQSRFYIATNWVIPIWYFLVIGFVLCVFVWFWWFYLRSRGGRGR